MSAQTTADGDVVVSWSTTASDLAGDTSSGPVKAFILRLYAGTSADMLRQYERVSTTAR
jgi:hypothetical protein